MPIITRGGIMYNTYGMYNTYRVLTNATQHFGGNKNIISGLQLHGAKRLSVNELFCNAKNI